MSEPAIAFNNTLSEEDRALKQRMLKQCEEDRLVLLTEQPFTAKLMMNLNLRPVVDDRLPTAATDGENLFFNAAFMDGRTQQDRRFILAHEVWHCALGHFRRQLGRDHQRWNRACDYEINQLLEEMLGHCPSDALYDKVFYGQSAETIYEKLEADPARNQGNPLDEHDIIAAHAMPAGVKIDPDFCPRTPQPSDGDTWRQRLIATAQQCQRGYGTLPGNLRLYLDRIRKPTVHWRTRMLRFLQKVPEGGHEWLPPNRRHVHRGLYLPRRRGEMLNIAVAIDASGSCIHQVPQFLSELYAILKSFDRVTLRVLTFDTEIRREEVLTERDIHRLRDWSVDAGGGTSFIPVFERLRKQPPQALVMLTDGFGSMPDWKPGYSVLWVYEQDMRP